MIDDFVMLDLAFNNSSVGCSTVVLVFVVSWNKFQNLFTPSGNRRKSSWTLPNTTDAFKNPLDQPGSVPLLTPFRPTRPPYERRSLSAVEG